MSVSPDKVVLRSNPLSSVMPSIISNYSNQKQFMNLYSLTTAPGYSSRHLYSKQNPHITHYESSLKGLIYNQCWLTTQNSIKIFQSDITCGQKIFRTEVRSKLGKIATFSISLDNLLIVFKDSLAICVSIDQMAASKQLAYIEEYNYNYKNTLMTVDYQVSNLRTAIIGQELVAIFLSGNNLVFQELSQSSTSSLNINLSHLGAQQGQSRASFQVCGSLLNLQCSPYLMILLAQITNKSGQRVTIVFQVLWNSKQYQFYKIICSQSKSSNRSTSSHICSLSSHRLALGIQGCIVICQREEFGWRTLFIIPYYKQLEGFISIQSPKEAFKSFLIVSYRDDSQRKIIKYDISALLKGSVFNPAVINSDRDIQGKYQCFSKLASSSALLFLSSGVYAIAPPILKLSKLIFEKTLEIQQQSSQLQVLYGVSCLQSQISFQCLQFSKFKQLLNADPNQIKRCIEQLFSLRALTQAIDILGQSLGQIISGMKAPTYFCIKSLLKQKSLIVIYLFRFMSYISRQDTQISSSFQINFTDLLNEIRFLKYGEVSLVEEPTVHSLIKKNFDAIRDNTLAMLTLFRRINSEVTDKEQYNQIYFKFYEIFSEFKIHQTLNCLRDFTALAERVTIMMYFSGLQRDDKKWSLCKEFLIELLALRRDFHPLICYLCSDMPLYMINRQHLHHCQQLMERERQELQWLPSLKDADYAAEKYLRQLGLQYLGSFVPNELLQNRYKADLMVIAIPEKLLKPFKDKYKEDTLEFSGKLYLLLKETKVIEVCQNMESKVNRFISPLLDIRNPACWCEKLQFLIQLFLHELKIDYKQKETIRNKNCLIRYDCRCFSNEIYEQIGQLIKPRDQKMTKQYTNQQPLVVPSFFFRLKTLAQDFDLGQYIKLQLKDDKQNTGSHNLLEQIDLSQILSKQQLEHSIKQQQVNKHKQKQDLPFLQILIDKLWHLYSALEYISNYHFEVEEQLHHQRFPHSFINISIHIQTIAQRYTHLLVQEHHSKVLEVNPLRKIRKALMNRKKIRLVSKRDSQFTPQQEGFLKNKLRIYLIESCFKLTHSWIFSQEQLVSEAALNQIPLQGMLAWVFRYFYQIMTF